MSMEKKTAIQIVHESWENSFPMWVKVLADERDRTSQTKVAKRIGYSPATVSQVLSNQYRGNLGVIEVAVKGTLMNEEISCPVVGLLNVQKCKDNQKRKSDEVVNHHQSALFHACPKCPHSEIEE